jgi:hypothetical protein
VLEIDDPLFEIDHTGELGHRAGDRCGRGPDPRLDPAPDHAPENDAQPRV